jgi:hypothetical protein
MVAEAISGTPWTAFHRGRLSMGDSSPGCSFLFMARILSAFYGTLAVVLGIAMNFSSIEPIRALYWSAVPNGVVAVPVMAMMMLISTNKRIMGKFTVGSAIRIRRLRSTSIPASRATSPAWASTTNSIRRALPTPQARAQSRPCCSRRRCSQHGPGPALMSAAPSATAPQQDSPIKFSETLRGIKMSAMIAARVIRVEPREPRPR